MKIPKHVVNLQWALNEKIGQRRFYTQHDWDYPRSYVSKARSMKLQRRQHQNCWYSIPYMKTTVNVIRIEH